MSSSSSPFIIYYLSLTMKMTQIKNYIIWNQEGYLKQSIQTKY